MGRHPLTVCCALVFNTLAELHQIFPNIKITLRPRHHVVFLPGNMTLVETARVSLLTDCCLQAKCNGLTLKFNTELCGALECV